MIVAVNCKLLWWLLCFFTNCYGFAEPTSDVKSDLHKEDHCHHHHHHQQQQQQQQLQQQQDYKQKQQQEACDSNVDNSAVANQLTGNRLTFTTAGNQLPQTSPSDCACSASSSANLTTISESSVMSTASSPDAVHCSQSSKNVLPPIYPVYHPYIFMGFSVQPFGYPPRQSDALAAVTGSSKHSGSKQLPAAAPHVAKRRHRKEQLQRQRKQHGGDVVSSTTPDSSLRETPRALPFPVEMTSSDEAAEEMMPLCLTVRRDKPVYDSCGALDLSIRKK